MEKASERRLGERDILHEIQGLLSTCERRLSLKEPMRHLVDKSECEGIIIYHNESYVFILYTTCSALASIKITKTSYDS